MGDKEIGSTPEDGVLSPYHRERSEQSAHHHLRPQALSE